jgi:phosphoglucosamine mutase
MMGLKKDM